MLLLNCRLAERGSAGQQLDVGGLFDDIAIELVSLDEDDLIGADAPLDLMREVGDW